MFYKLSGPKKAQKDVIFLESLTLDGAGYTYRVKHWEEILTAKGLQIESLSIVPDAETFFKESDNENLPSFLIKNIRVRIKQIIYSRNFKCVIVRRNLVIYNQYGQHFMEKLLSAVHPNCILDFDDDIGAQEPTKTRSKFHKIMQMTEHQFYGSFRYFDGFICGSEYLKNVLLAKYHCDNIEIIPTCVNYSEFEPKRYTSEFPEIITFGWIGGNHNLFLLETIIPYLNQLNAKTKIQLLIIAGVKDYPFNAEFPVLYDQFSLETEKKSILKMDIGLMPLIDDDVSRGKCGFKLLQYMGLGIPGIASAVTVNKEIVDDTINGWLVQNSNDWLPILEKAVASYPGLVQIGENARKTVDSRYSFKANSNKYYNFILKNIAK